MLGKANCLYQNVPQHYTALQKYAHIGLNQNLFRSTTLDIIARLLDSAAFVCVHVVGRFSKDFSEVRGLRSQQYYARNYEKKCKFPLQTKR